MSFYPILIIILNVFLQEKVTETKKAKKEENGDGDQDDDEEADGEDEIEGEDDEYDLPYGMYSILCK